MGASTSSSIPSMVNAQLGKYLQFGAVGDKAALVEDNGTLWLFASAFGNYIFVDASFALSLAYSNIILIPTMLSLL